MTGSRSDENFVVDLIRGAWLPWMGLVLVSGVIGAVAWKYRQGDKPTKSPKKPAVVQEAATPVVTSSTSVFESATRLPDGFRVSVVGKRIEYVGNPENLTSAVQASYESIQDVATACEAIVTETFEREKNTRDTKVPVRSSAGTVVTPRPNSVRVRMEYAGRVVEDYVDVPVAANGRNRLWGLAVRLVDQAHESENPTADARTPTAEPQKDSM